MAIWQYPFYVLPKSVSQLTDEQLINIFDEGQHVEAYWSDSGIQRIAFAEISDVLHPQKSWCATIDQYGKNDDNCFEVSYEGEKITDVWFRINFTNDFDTVLTTIMAFCKRNNLIILGENYRRLPENIEDIKAIMFNSSNAAVYAKLSNPDI